MELLLSAVLAAFTQNTVIQPQEDNIQVVQRVVQSSRADYQLQPATLVTSVSFDEANGDY